MLRVSSQRSPAMESRGSPVTEGGYGCELLRGLVASRGYRFDAGSHRLPAPGVVAPELMQVLLEQLATDGLEGVTEQVSQAGLLECSPG